MLSHRPRDDSFDCPLKHLTRLTRLVAQSHLSEDREKGRDRGQAGLRGLAEGRLDLGHHRLRVSAGQKR